MICRKVVYRNFRNIAYAEIEPSEGVTVLNGPNGQGKTNTLEGIFLFAGGRSFRTVHENELVRFGEKFAQIDMIYHDGHRDCTMSLRFVPRVGKRFCRKNGVPLTKLSEMVGNFRAVLFCPEHLAIVRDGPAVRRRFLDTALSQTDPGYLRSLQKYNAVLNQRNALIKMARDKHDDGIFLSTASLWSEQLAEEAEKIAATRAAYVEKLDAHVSAILSDMTGGTEKASLAYQTPRTREEYLRLLTENTERELRFGATLYGTHKDDILIHLGGREARSFGSQGQQRSIALAMKIAEGELSREVTGEYPVFLFDDILSELDASRRSYLLSGIEGRQVMITSCDEIEKDCKVYLVKDGEVSQRG